MTDPSTVVRVFYDFLENETTAKQYYDKCTPIIKEMYDNGFLISLLELVTIDGEFTSEENKMKIYKENLVAFCSEEAYDLNGSVTFDMEDFKDIQYCKSLIKFILNHTKDIDGEKTIDVIGMKDIIFGNGLPRAKAYIEQLSKLVMKRYVYSKRPTEVKVSCAIKFSTSSNLQIQVNCYNTIRNDEYKYSNCKGSVEINETNNNAIKRELKEELQISCIPGAIDKLFKLGNSNNRYQIEMIEADVDIYSNNLDTMNLDPEITRIVLIRIDPSSRIPSTVDPPRISRRVKAKFEKNDVQDEIDFARFAKEQEEITEHARFVGAHSVFK